MGGAGAGAGVVDIGYDSGIWTLTGALGGGGG